MTNLTGSEKVLYKATFNFAKEHHNCSDEQAHEQALQKIASIRALTKQLTYKY